MPDVAILLSTYNGAPFLPEQLGSLAAQEGLGGTALLWRDDGSTDNTREILRGFKLPGGMVREAAELPGRLGAARSFLALLAAAPEAPFYAFCDQDDVWLPGKLARAMEHLASLPADRPAFYCGRQQLVDAALQPLGLSPVPRRPLGFGNALGQNVATGCTMVLNAAARRLMVAAPPPPAGSIHDWWCYLMVTGAGGQVLFDPEPCILYRQHGRNVIGAAPSMHRRAIGAMRRGAQAFLRLFYGHLDSLAEARALLTPDAMGRIALLRESRYQGPLARLRAAQRAGLYRQTLSEDLVLRAWLTLGPEQNTETPPLAESRNSAG